ncbi:MAG: hypothetical protein MUQ10_15600 [Anaerolineae bacterium]|nr:hypothetical protein [Anaerolineae bacterium]
MSKVVIEAFVSIPPCSGGVAVKRLLKEIESEFGDQVEIVFHTGPGDAAWEEYAIGNAPALVVGDLVKWYPTVDPDKCVTCGMCMNCGKGVYDWTLAGFV